LPSNTEGSQSEVCLNKDNSCLNKEVETAACLNSAVETVKSHQFSLFEADSCLNKDNSCLNSDYACLNSEMGATTLVYDNESQTYTSVVTGDRFTLHHHNGIMVGVLYRMCRKDKVTLLGYSQIKSRYKMSKTRGNKTTDEWAFLLTLFRD
jgi:hypothetical protein